MRLEGFKVVLLNSLWQKYSCRNNVSTLAYINATEVRRLVWDNLYLLVFKKQTCLHLFKISNCREKSGILAIFLQHFKIHASRCTQKDSPAKLFKTTVKTDQAINLD